MSAATVNVLVFYGVRYSMHKVIKTIIFKLCLLLAPIAYCYAEIPESSLAFVANVDGNWDLFAVDEDGTNLQRLTSTPYDERDPSWSLDRQKIVYSTSDGQLNIIDVKTKEHQQLPVKTKGNPKTSPSFSPDGKRVAFVEFIPGRMDDTDLMIFDLETKICKTVLDQYGPQFWPAWSPDGSRLIYANTHCSVDCGRIIQELWITDTQGGYARQLLMTNALSQQPVWSPDERKIAFASDKGGNFDIWVLSLDGWKLEQMTTDEGMDVSPAWSPDGDEIAFISTKSGKMEIWVKDIKGGELRRVQPFGDKEIECKDVAW